MATSFFTSGKFTLIAGPCSIDAESTFFKTAQNLKEMGAQALRGAIFKMRTRPETFQGLGYDGIPILKKAKETFKLPIVTEITSARQIEKTADVVDMFQVGARNMFNYELLKELGQSKKPTMLKRSFSAKIDEWLGAADYLVRSGCEDVVLCERGIRTFEDKLRNTLDLSAVAYIKKNSPFPVIVDPSHGTGHRALVKPMSLAAAAAGADGVMIEVHDEREKALSDEFQAIDSKTFGEIVASLKQILPAFGKSL